MTQPNSPHFHRGKAARQANQPCRITDGRMTGKSREEWYAGWNFQDALLRGQPDAGLIEQNETFFADLRTELRKERV